MEPERSLRKASQRPSGDQRGITELSAPAVNWRGGCNLPLAPVSAGTSQMLERVVFASTSLVSTTYATWRPSGETCGSLAICNATRSSMETNGLGVAGAGDGAGDGDGAGGGDPAAVAGSPVGAGGTAICVCSSASLCALGEGAADVPAFAERAGTWIVVAGCTCMGSVGSPSSSGERECGGMGGVVVSAAASSAPLGDGGGVTSFLSVWGASELLWTAFV